VPSPSAATVPSPTTVTTPIPILTATLPTPPAPPAETPAAEVADDLEAPLDWRAFVPTDVADHLATMDRAARESGCGMPWHLLAAISRVESDFGRNMATSSEGAVGYGQFLPGSWEAFGNDGNVYDYRDALPAIAAYLCQSGLSRDPRKALFAYNHADWYVDLVLDLAARYDRMAPGAPIPSVLDVDLMVDGITPLRYATGRDVRLQGRAQALDGSVNWLGVPWRGRQPGAALSSASITTGVLAMLGVSGEAAKSITENEGLDGLANRAWEGGLLPLPTRSPSGWSLAEVRMHIGLGHPIVALLKASSLPGHLQSEAIADQPVVVIGMTPERLIYSDASFSSSLGYGLEIEDVAFLKAWQEASPPLRALAFRPRPSEHGTRARSVEPGEVFARVDATAIPPHVALPEETSTSVAPEEEPPIAAQTNAVSKEDVHDPSWLIVAAAGALLSVALFRRRRSPPS
jgi:hypothetical protein